MGSAGVSLSGYGWAREAGAAADATTPSAAIEPLLDRYLHRTSTAASLAVPSAFPSALAASASPHYAYASSTTLRKHASTYSSTKLKRQRAFEAAVRRSWVPSFGIDATDMSIVGIDAGSALHPDRADLTTITLRLPQHLCIILSQLLTRHDSTLKELGVRAVRELPQHRRRPPQVKAVGDWLVETSRLGRGKAAISELKRTLTHAISEGSLFRPPLRRSDTGELYRSRDGIRFSGGGARLHRDGSTARGFLTRDPVTVHAMGRMIAGGSGVTGA